MLLIAKYNTIQIIKVNRRKDIASLLKVIKISKQSLSFFITKYY